MLYPSLVATDEAFLTIGQGNGTNNEAQFGFYYAGNNLTSNEYFWSLANNANLMTLDGVGNLTTRATGSFGASAYTYGAPSATGAAALIVPATTYTLTGGSPANFRNIFGHPHFH